METKHKTVSAITVWGRKVDDNYKRVEEDNVYLLGTVDNKEDAEKLMLKDMEFWIKELDIVNYPPSKKAKRYWKKEGNKYKVVKKDGMTINDICEIIFKSEFRESPTVSYFTKTITFNVPG